MKKIGVFILALVLVVSCMTFTVNMNGFTGNENPIQPIEKVYANEEELPVDGGDGNSIELTKTVDKGTARIGETVYYTIEVTNKGSNLAGVEVIDRLIDYSDPVIPLTYLNTNDSVAIIEAYTIKFEDVADGKVINTARATAQYEVGSEVRTASAIVEVEPLLKITKEVSPTSARVGNTVQYYITVENTSNQVMDSVTVTDLRLGLNHYIGDLAGNTVVSIPAIEYTVQEEHVINHVVTNEAIVSGSFPGADFPTIEKAIATLDILPPVGSITIDKVILDEEEDLTEFKVRVEGVDNYSEDFTISSAGSTIIQDLSLGKYTITELLNQMPSGYEFVQLIVNGEVLNGTEIELTKDLKDVTVIVVNRKIPKGIITIEKEIEGADQDSTEFEVRLVGENNYLEDFTVSMGNPVTQELNIGTYTITELIDQIPSGYDFVKLIVNGVEHLNNETEIELSEEVNDVTVTVVNREIPTGTIAIEKEVENKNQDDTEFEVRITGDDNYQEDFIISMGNPVTKELSIGTYTITELSDQIPSGYEFVKLMVNGVEYSNEADIELTEEANEITVKVINKKNESPPPPSRDKAKIRIEKTVSPTTANTGDEVEYVLTAKNIGDYTLTDVTITDPILGELDDFKLGTLKKGESKVVNVSYKIPEGVSGQLKNTATVTGKRGVKTVSDTDSAVVVVIESLPNNPAIDIVKSVDKAVAQPGEIVLYTFVVTNTGDVGLENVEVTDSLLGEEWRHNIGSLAVGKQVTFAENYIVSEGASGDLENVAFATGSYGSETVIDSAKVSVEIQVLPDLPYTGGPVEPEMVMAGMGGIAILVGKIYGNKKNKK